MYRCVYLVIYRCVYTLHVPNLLHDADGTCGLLMTLQASLWLLRFHVRILRLVGILRAIPKDMGNTHGRAKEEALLF